MTASELELKNLQTTPNEAKEEFSIPLNISDIISICREFSKLSWKVQSQVENILELGVEEAIKIGIVKQESLPHIKDFLLSICQNPYFGDAILQAEECIFLIDDYYDKYTNSVLN